MQLKEIYAGKTLSNLPPQCGHPAAFPGETLFWESVERPRLNIPPAGVSLHYPPATPQKRPAAMSPRRPQSRSFSTGSSRQRSASLSYRLHSPSYGLVLTIHLHALSLLWPGQRRPEATDLEQGRPDAGGDDADAQRQGDDRGERSRRPRCRLGWGWPLRWCIAALSTLSGGREAHTLYPVPYTTFLVCLRLPSYTRRRKPCCRRSTTRVWRICCTTK